MSTQKTELDRALDDAYPGEPEQPERAIPYSRTLRHRDISARTGRWASDQFWLAHVSGIFDPRDEDVAWASNLLQLSRSSSWEQEMIDDLDAAEQDFISDVGGRANYWAKIYARQATGQHVIDTGLEYIRRQRALLDRAHQIDTELEQQLEASIAANEAKKVSPVETIAAPAAEAFLTGQTGDVVRVEAVLGGETPFQIVTRNTEADEPFQAAILPGSISNHVDKLELEATNVPGEYIIGEEGRQRIAESVGAHDLTFTSPNEAAWSGDAPIPVGVDRTVDQVFPVEETVKVSEHERSKSAPKRAKKNAPAGETPEPEPEVYPLRRRILELEAHVENLTLEATELTAAGIDKDVEIARLKSATEERELGLVATLNYLSSMEELVGALEQEIEIVERRARAVKRAGEYRTLLHISRTTWPRPEVTMTQGEQHLDDLARKGGIPRG